MEMVDIVHITSEQEKMLNCSNGPFSSMIYIDWLTELKMVNVQINGTFHRKVSTNPTEGVWQINLGHWDVSDKIWTYTHYIYNM